MKDSNGDIVGADVDTSIADYSLTRAKIEKTTAGSFYKLIVNSSDGSLISCPDMSYDSNNVFQVGCVSNFTGICSLNSRKFYEQSFTNCTAVQNCSNITFAAGKSYMLKVVIMVKPSSLDEIAQNECISFYVSLILRKHGHE